MRVSLGINDSLSDAGILFLFAAYQVCVMDPLVRSVIVSKSGPSGVRLEKVSSRPVEVENLLSVEAEVFPWSENSSGFARQRLNIRDPVYRLCLLVA